MGKIGDVCESRSKVTIEWKIKDFSSLSQEINVRYESPMFYFAGSSWDIWLYPNGQKVKKSEGYLGLYLVRRSNGSSVTLDYSFKFKTLDGENEPYCSYNERTFDKKNSGLGVQKFISRSDLLERKSKLTPLDILTVICTVTSCISKNVTDSLFYRHQKLRDNLKETYTKAKRSDCTLKVDGEDVPAHRLILEMGSPVFAAMFTHDTKENQTGEIAISDVGKSTMEFLLEYMYSGDTKKFKTENVLSVYAAAEKYDIPDIKKMCEEFIVRNLSVDWVCDVIKFAELYNEEEISSRAKEFFKENARQILNTENWKTFARENHDITVQLLSSLIVALLPE